MAYLPNRREFVSRLAVCRNSIRQYYEAALGRVPTDCLLCHGRAKGGRLCTGCLASVVLSMRSEIGRCKVCCLDFGRYLRCPDCASQRLAFDRIIAAFDYSAPGDLLIQHFKSGRRFAYARTLAEILACAVSDAVPVLPKHTILVAVPASRASIKQRGFNPAAEVARYLAWQLQLTYRPGLLRRNHEGSAQKHLTRAQRMQQVLQLYSCSVRVDNAAIAVVDDVLTTGSTLHSIARELKAAGAASVCGLVLARTPYR